MRTGDPRFHALLKEIGDLHDLKQQDYGTDEDPFANVRGSQEWGVQPWIGSLVRAGDKVKRLQLAARGSKLSNEGVEDSLLDLAVYAIIGLVLYREGHQYAEAVEKWALLYDPTPTQTGARPLEDLEEFEAVALEGYPGVPTAVVPRVTRRRPGGRAAPPE